MPENTTLETPSVATLYSTHPFYILEKNSATSFFEPVVSVHKRGVIGLESLCRAVDPESLGLIEPRDLFRNMDEGDFYVKLGLDRLFRQKGLESFTSFQAQKPNLLLFMDIEPSVLEENIVGSGYLAKQVEEFPLEARQVVVQIPLSGKISHSLVDKFIQIHRRNGFLVCLKDANAGPTRMKQLLSFNPDLVKLEDSLSRGLARNPEKKAAFRGVVKLAHALGVVVMAGNLDNEEDALAALELGADLLQGKYFSKNYKKNLVFTLDRRARMMFLSARFRRRLGQRARRDRELFQRCEKVGGRIFTFFENEKITELEAVLPFLSRLAPALECLYFLNSRGIQVGRVACNRFHIPENQRFLFEPSAEGSDLSLRECYYALSNEKDRVITEPFLSMNSGHLCVTASMLIDDPASGDFHVLCADLNLSKV